MSYCYVVFIRQFVIHEAVYKHIQDDYDDYGKKCKVFLDFGDATVYKRELEKEIRMINEVGEFTVQIIQKELIKEQFPTCKECGFHHPDGTCVDS